jgi:hypothetical protein
MIKNFKLIRFLGKYLIFPKIFPAAYLLFIITLILIYFSLIQHFIIFMLIILLFCFIFFIMIYFNNLNLSLSSKVLEENIEIKGHKFKYLDSNEYVIRNIFHLRGIDLYCDKCTTFLYMEYNYGDKKYTIFGKIDTCDEVQIKNILK